MSAMRGRNRGATRLPLRRRPADPMQEYDRLPSALRRWLANAQRPWSPHSCRAIWQATLARGGDTQEALGQAGTGSRQRCWPVTAAKRPSLNCTLSFEGLLMYRPCI